MDNHWPEFTAERGGINYNYTNTGIGIGAKIREGKDMLINKLHITDD